MNLTELSHYVKFVIVRNEVLEMERKPFKVMTRYDIGEDLNFATLTEVLGYFKNLEAESVFVYFNKKNRQWYIIDLLCGLAIASGKTMQEAEESFCYPWKLEYYRNYQKTKKYYSHIQKYNELLKDYMEVKNVNSTNKEKMV